MDDSNDRQIEEFVAEGKEHLSVLEPNLLELEQHGENCDDETINSAFRAVHNIKGTSGFFGFETVKNLCHEMESVMGKIREKKMVPNAELMDMLFSGVDLLKKMFADIYASNGVDCNKEIQDLKKYSEGPGSVQKQAETTPPKPDEEVLKDLYFDMNDINMKEFAAKGKHVYYIQVYLNKDLKEKKRSFEDLLSTLEGAGQIVKSEIDISQIHDLDDCFDQDICWHMFYATVLESSLVSIGCSLEENQIFELPSPMEEMKAQSMTASPVQKQEPVLEYEEEVVTQNTVETEAEKQKTDEIAKASSKSSFMLETVRVRVDLLNQMMNLAGELVLSRNQLLRSLEAKKSEIGGLDAILQHLDIVTSNLQETIIQTRMQPVGNVFMKMPRLVRDVSRILNKKIDIFMKGNEVELDRSIIEALSDTLTHILRNCCDHGIEDNADRVKKGKPEVGNIWLAAYHESGQVKISIQDDGGGINTDKVAKKAVTMGVMTAEEVGGLSHQEKLELIFLPGMSTAAQVQELSGRGVGMDVARINIEKLGGTIDISSTLGEGTTFCLRLPLTLAIIPSLIVRVANLRFAVPQANLVELVWVKANEVSKKIEKVGAAHVLRLRGNLLPLVRLADILGIDRTFYDYKTGEYREDRRQRLEDRRQGEVSSDDAEEKKEDKRKENDSDRRQHWRSDLNILVLRMGANQFGLVVDELLEVEEIVVKPLSNYIKECKCFAGSTIMGDGKVAMILDPGGIANYAKLSFAELQSEAQRRAKEKEKALSSSGSQDKKTVLLFTNHPDEVFAIPLEIISRLESFQVDRIQQVGDKQYINYRDKSLPLIPLEEHLPVRPFPKDIKDAYLIIPKERFGKGGILASAIIDTIETNIILNPEGSEHHGVSGSAIIKDKMTLFLDPKGLLESYQEGS